MINLWKQRIKYFRSADENFKGCQGETKWFYLLSWHLTRPDLIDGLAYNQTNLSALSHFILSHKFQMIDISSCPEPGSCLVAPWDLYTSALQVAIKRGPWKSSLEEVRTATLNVFFSDSEAAATKSLSR